MFERTNLDLTSKLLIGAAERMATKGYWKPSMGSRQQRVCAMYALHDEAFQSGVHNSSDPMSSIYLEAVSRLAIYLNVNAAGPYTTVPDWSDSHTSEEVIAAFRETAY